MRPCLVEAEGGHSKLEPSVRLSQAAPGQLVGIYRLTGMVMYRPRFPSATGTYTLLSVLSRIRAQTAGVLRDPSSAPLEASTFTHRLEPLARRKIWWQG